MCKKFNGASDRFKVDLGRVDFIQINNEQIVVVVVLSLDERNVLAPQLRQPDGSDAARGIEAVMRNEPGMRMTITPISKLTLGFIPGIVFLEDKCRFRKQARNAFNIL